MLQLHPHVYVSLDSDQCVWRILGHAIYCMSGCVRLNEQENMRGQAENAGNAAKLGAWKIRQIFYYTLPFTELAIVRAGLVPIGCFIVHLILKSSFKRTVSRDFRPSFFFSNQSPLGQWLTA
jgi:ABC-type spermidine/putrescine transport system permease subunit II